MKYIEDDFDLEEFKKSYMSKIIIRIAPKHKILNIIINILIWVIALLVAIPLYRGGQYLIDLVSR